MSYTLHAIDGVYTGQKALIAAQYGNVEINVPALEFGKDNKTPEFLANKNPLGKVPVLETPEGCVFESNAIARYVAKLSPSANLMGRSFHEEALVEQWLDFASLELGAPASMICYPILKIMKFDARSFAQAEKDLAKLFAILDNHYKVNMFTVGNGITLADIVLACTLKNLFTLYADEAKRSEYPHLTRWFTTCVHQKEFVAVFGKLELCKVSQRPEGGKKEKAKTAKPAKKAASPKAKAASPKAKPSKSALDSLPKASMSMDDIKRLYSNNDFKVANAQFLEMLAKEPEAYSVYEASYNYNQDNTVYFMTCNLVGGFMQRLDSLRKYGAGSLVILGGDSGPWDINTAWIFRGTEIPEPMKDCPDAEYYTFKRLDVLSDAGRSRFATLWDGESVDGKTVQERRLFK